MAKKKDLPATTVSVEDKIRTVKLVGELGIRKAASLAGVTVKIVRKWIEEYSEVIKTVENESAVVAEVVEDIAEIKSRQINKAFELKDKVLNRIGTILENENEKIPIRTLAELMITLDNSISTSEAGTATSVTNNNFLLLANEQLKNNNHELNS